MMSSAQVSEANTTASPSRPIASGRQPRGSRAAMQRVAHRDDQAVRALDTGCSASASRSAGVAAFERARRWTTTSESFVDEKIDPCSSSSTRSSAALIDVAVVRERDVAALRARDDRLRILDRRRAGRAVARVSDGRDAGQLGQLLAERVGQCAHVAHRARVAGRVDRHDADRFLSAMLQRVQAELRDVRRVGVAVNAEYAAHWLLAPSYGRTNA